MEPAHNLLPFSFDEGQSKFDNLSGKWYIFRNAGRYSSSIEAARRPVPRGQKFLSLEAQIRGRNDRILRKLLTNPLDEF